MYESLNATKALIFRIIHAKNLPWILSNGVHCRSSNTSAPQYVEIGNPELISKRTTRNVPVPPSGTLSDYVPFYFTPFSPMLLNIKTGWGGIRQRSNDEILILASSLHRLKELGVPFVFTDRHAYLAAANFYSSIDKLDAVDWLSLQKKDFKKDPNDPEKFERYQAEALVYKRVPIDALHGIACYTEQVRLAISQQVSDSGLKLQIAARPKWYF